MAYTLLLKNNASRSEYVVRGLVDEGTDLIHFFRRFSMPEGAQEGEYTYVLFYDEAEDPKYELKDDILESVVTSEGVSIAVKHLNPETGILRYEENGEKGTYLPNNKDNRYYTK